MTPPQRVTSKYDGKPTYYNYANGDVPIPKLEEKNTSGIVPMDLRVLVLPDGPGAMIGSIHIPESVQDKERFAQCKGTLIAVGENAWEEASSRSPNFVKPVPGARVLIAKYGGVLLKGADGVEYRIMNDEDVIARLEE